MNYLTRMNYLSRMKYLSALLVVCSLFISSSLLYAEDFELKSDFDARDHKEKISALVADQAVTGDIAPSKLDNKLNDAIQLTADHLTGIYPQELYAKVTDKVLTISSVRDKSIALGYTGHKFISNFETELTAPSYLGSEIELLRFDKQAQHKSSFTITKLSSLDGISIDFNYQWNGNHDLLVSYGFYGVLLKRIGNELTALPYYGDEARGHAASTASGDAQGIDNSSDRNLAIKLTFRNLHALNDADKIDRDISINAPVELSVSAKSSTAENVATVAGKTISFTQRYPANPIRHVDLTFTAMRTTSAAGDYVYLNEIEVLKLKD